MSSDRKRLLGNVLIFGVSAPAVLAILILGLVTWPWGGDGQALSYWLLPIMLVAITAAHIGSKVKATATR